MTSRIITPLLLASITASLPGCAVAYYDPTESDEVVSPVSDETRQTTQGESTATTTELVGTGGSNAEQLPEDDTSDASDEIPPTATGGSEAAGGGEATGGSPASGGDKASGGSQASGGSEATGGAESTGGGSPEVSCDSATVRDNAKCGDIIEHQGVTYVCLSQASGVNGETTGCGVSGVYCSTIDPLDSSWGTTAWAEAECPLP